MENEIIICIPGTWQNREEFLKNVVVSTSGEFMPAGRILANPKGNDHVEFDFYESDDRIREAFVSAGQGKISSETLDKIAKHKSVVYLYFPFDIISQKT
jgi:ribosomal protein RSM22 (predicted rRNA methylase)